MGKDHRKRRNRPRLRPREIRAKRRLVQRLDVHLRDEVSVSDGVTVELIRASDLADIGLAPPGSAPSPPSADSRELREIMLPGGDVVRVGAVAARVIHWMMPTGDEVLPAQLEITSALGTTLVVKFAISGRLLNWLGVSPRLERDSVERLYVAVACDEARRHVLQSPRVLNLADADAFRERLRSLPQADEERHGLGGFGSAPIGSAPFGS